MAVKVNREFLKRINFTADGGANVSCMFIWRKTPEGCEFWSREDDAYWSGKQDNGCYSGKARRIIRRWRAARKKFYLQDMARGESSARS